MHMSTLIMWHNRFSENENEAVESHIPRHRDSKTKKPRHRETYRAARRCDSIVDSCKQEITVTCHVKRCNKIGF